MADTEKTSSLTKPIWSPLLDEHLAEVTRINAELQIHPWNLKHWQSSQLPNYRNWVILDPQPIAYISFMLARDTAELMNIGVSQPSVTGYRPRTDRRRDKPAARGSGQHIPGGAAIQQNGPKAIRIYGFSGNC